MSDLGDFTTFDDDSSDESSAASQSDETGSDDAGATGESATEAPEEETARFEEMDVEPAGKDRGLGVLSASEGLSISEEDDDTRLRAYVTVGNRSDIRVGTYLLAPYPDGEQLFCRITGLEYAREFRGDDATEIHARRAMRSSGIDEQDFKLMASLEPTAVIYSDGTAGDGSEDLKRRMADRVPKPETIVRRARDKREIKTGLKIPEDGVFLGHLSVGGERVRTAAKPPTIDYRLKDDYASGDPLVFRHTLVAGGTGSGKTHAAKNVLRQYLAEDRRYPIEGGDREVRPGASNARGSPTAATKTRSPSCRKSMAAATRRATTTPSNSNLPSPSRWSTRTPGSSPAVS